MSTIVQKVKSIRTARIPLGRIKTRKYHVEDFYHRHEKTYFPINESQIKLLLYKGNIDDIYQQQSHTQSIIWKEFFQKVIYQNRISWDYMNIVGLPHGIVYNHKNNEIKTFDDHYELHDYFMTNYKK